MKIIIGILLVACIAISCNKESCIKTINLSEVVVLDANFNELQTINDSISSASISLILQQVQVIDPLTTETSYDYKLDIKSNCYEGRWLYDAQVGILAKLNYQSEPVLKINNVEALQKLIKGI